MRYRYPVGPAATAPAMERPVAEAGTVPEIVRLPFEIDSMETEIDPPDPAEEPAPRD